MGLPDSFRETVSSRVLRWPPWRYLACLGEPVCRKARAQPVEIEHGGTIRRFVLPKMEDHVLPDASITGPPALVAWNTKKNGRQMDPFRPQSLGEYPIHERLLSLALHNDYDPGHRYSAPLEAT